MPPRPHPGCRKSVPVRGRVPGPRPSRRETREDPVHGRHEECPEERKVLVNRPLDDSFKFLSLPTVFDTHHKCLKTDKKMFSVVHSQSVSRPPGPWNPHRRTPLPRREETLLSPENPRSTVPLLSLRPPPGTGGLRELRSLLTVIVGDFLLKTGSFPVDRRRTCSLPPTEIDVESGPP